MRLSFAIVGEPKSGTTAMYTYLSGHPRVAMSRRKEPRFWSPDLPTLARVADLDEYEALWYGADPHALRGEASTNYLQSTVAVPAIRKHNPQVRLIAMIRNPLDMAPALHSENLNSYLENVGDFARAWRLQERRRRGDRVPPECVDARLILYRDRCAIGDHLERFFGNVPPDCRHVIVFDDLARDPAAAYRGVLAFLDLPDDGRTSFTPERANLALRSARLTGLHRSMPRRLGPLYAPARAAARRLGLSPSRLVNRINVRQRPRPPLAPDVRAELAEVFAPQVHKVSALLERDLSHWL